MPFDSLPEIPRYDDAGCLLIKARALIVKHGWCQHTLFDDKVRLCAVGAISFAADGMNSVSGFATRSEAILRLAQTLPRGKLYMCCEEPRRAHYAQRHVTYWNDRKSRTKKQVLAKFDLAIANSRVFAGTP
jgi:hypothetical protein